MSETKKGLWARLTSKLVSQGGGGEPEEMSFRRLAEATKIEVQTKLNYKVKTIEDPAIIKAVLEFMQGQKAGWLPPKYSAPITDLRLAFSNGNQALGQLGFGPTLLTTMEFGSSYIKTIPKEEYVRLRTILSLN